MQRWWILFGLAVVVAQPAAARVKLAALPDRERMVVSLAHPNATLVEEERVVTLQQGVNRVDFSWQAVAIDADSIQVRALDHPGDVRVLNTSYPPGENALVWEISSPGAQEERLRISYLLSGLARETVYKAVAAPDEKSLSLRTYLRLNNQTGEDLADADIVPADAAPVRRSLQNDEIVELQIDKADSVAVNKELCWDAASMPWEPEYEAVTPGVPLAYVVLNDRTSGLGAHTLRSGKARIFLATKERGDKGEETGPGMAFLGEDVLALTPVDRELRMKIGESRDVKVVQHKVKDDRTHIVRNKWNQDVLWDTDEEYRIEVQNFKKEPVALVLVEHVPGYWRMFSYSEPYTKKDAFTVEFPLKLGPESKRTVTFHINRMNVQGDQEPVGGRGGAR